MIHATGQMATVMGHVVGVPIVGDREAALDALEATDDGKGGDYLRVTMPCGEQQAYDSRGDVPTENVPCPCEDPMHLLVGIF